MISEWAANGNVMDYVRDNAGNHLKLVGRNLVFFHHLLSASQLADVVEGLKYLLNADMVDGNLKGVSLSVKSREFLSCDCLGQHPDYEFRPRRGMPHGLRVHDHRARPKPRAGLIRI